MNIRKFVGKNQEEALKIAQKEVGENYVIFNTRVFKTKGFIPFFKKSMVEVTVATKEDEDNTSVTKNDIVSAIASVDRLRQGTDEAVANTVDSKQKDNSQAVEQKLDNIQNLLEEKLKKAETQPVVEKPDIKPVIEELPKKTENDNEPSSEIVNFIKLLYNTMVDNEIREQFANQMIEDIEQKYNKDMSIEYILSHIYQKMILKFGKNEYIEASAKGPKVIYFIGPTGVGKTTTLAKIASQLYLVEHKKIAMFTIDTYRMGASDQLKSYANIMDVPMEILYKAEDMQQAFKKYSDFNYILVDTAGHSSKNEEMSENTNIFLHCLDDLAEKEVYLVLSATTKYKDLINIADYYSKMADYKLIFTKLDETSALGNLLNLRLHTNASMSYITCGQNVPDDFEKFDAQKIVRKLLITENN